jgi:DNA-binding HxlR family transcriptional regulator
MADKHSIAQLLRRRAERWNSPAEIKAAIADVPNRTLSRGLGELAREGDIERPGSRKGTRYRWKSTVKDEQRKPAVADGMDAVFSPESGALRSTDKRAHATLVPAFLDYPTVFGNG